MTTNNSKTPEEMEQAKLIVRDARGNNTNFSDRLNTALQDAAADGNLQFEE
jgi:hypothetical protein